MRWRLSLISVVIAVTAAGCFAGPTPNPAIEASVEAMAGIPVSGAASLAQVASDRVSVHIEVLPDDLPDVDAEIRRGDCASTDVIARLSTIRPDNPYLFQGQIAGTLTSVRPSFVVLLEAETGLLIACARFE
jgi:hypothetical protein